MSPFKLGSGSPAQLCHTDNDIVPAHTTTDYISIFQETILVWLARSSLWGLWATTSSKSTSPLPSLSSSPGSHSGSTEEQLLPEWAWEWPLCSPWPPSSHQLTQRFPKYPMSSQLTSILLPVSSWSLHLFSVGCTTILTLSSINH